LKKVLLIVVLAALLAPVAIADESSRESQPSMVERALSWLGVKYRFGGHDEKRGFDCAGLVRRVFSTAVELPRTAAAQYREGCVVERDELQPGDLVFFRNTYKRGISHVGIYIGNGEFVHAASRRHSVRIDRLDSPYFDSRFAGGRRVMTAPVLTPPLPEEIPAGLP
jgi:cell wall-associated NlpC family hydrolase